MSTRVTEGYTIRDEHGMALMHVEETPDPRFVELYLWGQPAVYLDAAAWDELTSLRYRIKLKESLPAPLPDCAPQCGQDGDAKRVGG